MLLINDNLTALNAANNLDSTDSQLSTVVSQLSSGLQIQTAADNPAGYSIAENLQYEINGYGAAVSNAQTAVSVLQTAQGAMNQQEAILQQMNTLATQAANSNVEMNSTAADADQAEFNALVAQLNQISSSTQYAGINLLAGTNNTALALTFQIGPSANSANQVTISINTTSAASLSVSGLTITSATAALSAMASVQAAINTLASYAAVVGAAQNQIQALSNNITVAQQNLTAAHANLVDVNVASATSQFTALQILEQSGVAVLSQAQSLPQFALKLI
jgi:flagellin